MNFHITCHSPSCQTQSKAFLKSVEFERDPAGAVDTFLHDVTLDVLFSWCCRICSTVLLPVLKPAYSSAGSSSAMVLM